MVSVGRNENTVDDYYLISKTSRLVPFIRHFSRLGYEIEMTRVSTFPIRDGQGLCVDKFWYSTVFRSTQNPVLPKRKKWTPST